MYQQPGRRGSRHAFADKSPTFTLKTYSPLEREGILHAQKSGSLKPLSDSEVESYAGIYQGRHTTVDIYIKDDKLFFSSGTRDYQMNMLGKRNFQLEEHPVFLSFSGRQNEHLTIDES